MGVGYFPAPFDFAEDVFLFSIGFKTYVPNSGLYLDFQFGSFGVEAKEFTHSSYYYSFTESSQETLYGPSILLGGDWFGQNIGFNAAIGVSYNMVEIEWVEMKYMLAGDIGFIIML